MVVLVVPTPLTWHKSTPDSVLHGKNDRPSCIAFLTPMKFRAQGNAAYSLVGNGGFPMAFRCPMGQLRSRSLVWTPRGFGTFPYRENPLNYVSESPRRSHLSSGSYYRSQLPFIARGPENGVPVTYYPSLIVPRDFMHTTRCLW